jgi:hypothetical protein
MYFTTSLTHIFWAELKWFSKDLKSINKFKATTFNLNWTAYKSHFQLTILLNINKHKTYTITNNYSYDILVKEPLKIAKTIMDPNIDQN